MTFVHTWKKGNRPETFVLFHGTGGTERSLIPLAECLGPDFGILSPRGQVMEGTKTRYFKRFSEGVFDEADLDLRTLELADWIQGMEGEKEIDPQNVIALGYSNGATIIASLLYQRPNLFKKAILLRPSVPFSRGDWPDLSNLQVLLLNGQKDEIVRASHADELAKILISRGAQVQNVQIPADHGLTELDMDTMRQWLKL